jgi:hypothetical protein
MYESYIFCQQYSFYFVQRVQKHLSNSQKRNNQLVLSLFKKSISAIWPLLCYWDNNEAALREFVFFQRLFHYSSFIQCETDNPLTHHYQLFVSCDSNKAQLKQQAVQRLLIDKNKTKPKTLETLVPESLQPDWEYTPFDVSEVMFDPKMVAESFYKLKLQSYE